MKFGKKWALIGEELPQRSQHAIKNRFYQLIAKFLKVSNFEVIHSKRNYHEEALGLLENLRNYQISEIAKQKFIKQENQ